MNLSAWIGAFVAVFGGAWGGGAKVVSLADARYVRSDSFSVYQQSEARHHLADSLNLAAEMRDVRRYLAGLDSSDRCRRGQSGFCR